MFLKLEGARFSQRGCVSEIGAGPFQSEGCFSGGMVCFSNWRGSVSVGGGVLVTFRDVRAVSFR